MSIPIVDFACWRRGDENQRRRLSAEIARICHQTGFFYLVEHGLPAEETSVFQEMMRRFFALPLNARQAIDKRQSPQFRGWEQLGSELTNNQVDYREQLDIGVDRAPIADPDPFFLALIGPNQWPDEALIPGFRACVESYFSRLSALARELLSAMSLGLGLDQNHINRVFGAEPAPYLKLIRYPRTEAGGQGVGTHKDSGFLTLLLQDQHAGLEAQGNDNRWHRVDPMAGSLVVNTGELMQLITLNYFIATPHRVINRANAERYSSAFFYSPDLTTRLDPLPLGADLVARAEASPRHRQEGLMASRAELARGIDGMASRQMPRVFGEKYWQRWVRSYPAIAQKYYPRHSD